VAGRRFPNLGAGMVALLFALIFAMPASAERQHVEERPSVYGAIESVSVHNMSEQPLFGSVVGRAYLRAQGGVNFHSQEAITGFAGTTFHRTSKFNTGSLIGAAGGFDFGDFRIEGEYLYRENDIDSLTGGVGVGGGEGSTHTVTANFIYDFDTDFTDVDFHFGVGLGLAQVSLDNVTQGGMQLIDDKDSVFAAQLLFGVSRMLTAELSANVDYRFLKTADPEFRTVAGGNVRSGVEDHSVLFGLTWHLGSQPTVKPSKSSSGRLADTRKPIRSAEQSTPRSADTPSLALPTVPREKQTFLAFFDWDQADIRPDAMKILIEAAGSAKQGVLTVIRLTGHADRSGPRRYNQTLSERRAMSVKNFLIEQGVAADSIVTLGRGENDSLIATEDNVREPKNRRVEIILP